MPTSGGKPAAGGQIRAAWRVAGFKDAMAQFLPVIACRPVVTLPEASIGSIGVNSNACYVEETGARVFIASEFNRMVVLQST